MMATASEPASSCMVICSQNADGSVFESCLKLGHLDTTCTPWTEANRKRRQITLQAWQAEPEDDPQQGRAWSAPSQPQRQWDSHPAAAHQASQAVDGSHMLPRPPVLQAETQGFQQSNAVPSAVQERAAQYAGDEGLARPPTRPPSDWRSRQAQTHGEEAMGPTSNRDGLSSDRCLLLRQHHVSVLQSTWQYAKNSQTVGLLL